jgi:hypothetical protein
MESELNLDKNTNELIENDESMEQDKNFLSNQEVQLKSKCKEMKELWSHPESDQLAMLKAIGAFFYSENEKDFCYEYMLHLKKYERS